MPTLYSTTTVLLLLSFCCFFSCIDSKQDVAAFKTLDKSLKENNEILQAQIERSYNSLERKLDDPKSAEKAKVIMPHVIVISKSSTALINYIDSISADISKVVSLENTNSKQVFDEADRTVAKKIFTQQKLTTLKGKLAQFRSQMLGIDTIASRQLQTIIDDILKEESEIVDHFSFGNLPAIGAISMLTRLQNKVRIVEQLMVQFCDSRVSSYEEDFYTEFSALSMLSSKYVKRGDEVEVSAGVGAFSLKAKPKVMFNGKHIPVNVEGMAVYKFQAPNRPGKYFITTNIEFTDYDDRQHSIQRKLNYVVLK